MYALFLKLLNMSAAGSVLILAVIVLRALLKKAPRWIPCALWALVALRLVCPVGIASPLSVFRAAPTIVSQEGEVEVFRPAGGSEKPMVSMDTVQIERPRTNSETIAEIPGTSLAVTERSRDAYLPPLLQAYLLGVSVLLLYAVVSTLRLKRKVAASLPLEGNVRVCDTVPSPFILGLFRPRIYLPSTLDGEERELVLAHERAHIRRLDHVWKPLGFLILSLHWFNPLCWLAYALLCRDIELACDEKVIHTLGDAQRAAYSQALLNCSARRLLAACPVAFGETGVKTRVRAVLSYKKPAFWLLLAAAVGGIVLIACFASDPPPATAGEHEVWDAEEFLLRPGNENIKAVEPVGQIPEEFQPIIEKNAFCDATAFDGVLLKAEISPDSGKENGLIHQVRMMDRYGTDQAVYTCLSDDNYRITTLTATDDGGFLFVLGFTDHALSQDVWASDSGFASHVIKCDKSGRLQFDTPFEDVEGSALKYCFEKNGRFYLFGTIQTPETKSRSLYSPTDIYAAVLDSDGTVIRTGLVAGSDYDSLDSAEPCDGGFRLSIHSQSEDGDFAGSGSKGYSVTWVIILNDDLKIVEKRKETGRDFTDNRLGTVDGAPVYRYDVTLGGFDAGSPTAVIDYGDFILIVSENATGAYEKTPGSVSRIWLYWETVYSAYDKNGDLLFRASVDSSPDYDAMVETFYAAAPSTVPDPPPEKEIPTFDPEEFRPLYQEVLDRYRAALAAGDVQSMGDVSGLIRIFFGEDALSRVGWSLRDLDLDGVPELLIGCVDNEEFYGPILFDVYTLSEGEPVRLFQSTERDRWYDLASQLLLEESSGGASHTAWTVWSLEWGEPAFHDGVILDGGSYTAMSWENGARVPGRELEREEAEYWINHFEATVRRAAFTPFAASDPPPAAAELGRAEISGECGKDGDNLTWSYSGGVLTITGKGEMEDYEEFDDVPWRSVRKDIKRIELPEGLTSIGDWAFSDCGSLTSVTLPESLTAIGDSAFSGCGSLTTITLQGGLKSIGDRAFSNCWSLTSITLPEGLTSIGKDAFFWCKSLTSITLPDSVTTVGANPFEVCSKLTEITVSPDHPYLATIDGVLFSKPDRRLICCTAGLTAERYTVPDGIQSIGDRAFEDCDGLTSINLPEGLTSIGDGAFSGCDGLTSITLPDSVTAVGDEAFSYCKRLTSVTLPEGLTAIGDRAFSWCDSLTSITLPESVMTIGDEAFSYCESLTSITLPEGLTAIGKDAFFWCKSLTSITLPDSVTTVGANPFGVCSKLTEITVSPDHPYLATIDGVLFSKPDRRLICCPAGLTAERYTVPDGIQSIGDRAFEDCDGLTSIALPEGLTSIGDGAFYDCNGLTLITLPEGLTTIGDGAFYSCDGLTSITLPDSVTAVGDEAFSYCKSLTSITLPEGLATIGDRAFSDCDSLTSITLPESLTSIGIYAFYECGSLTSVTLPEGLTSIGNSAFSWCVRLTSITLPEGLPTIGDYAFYNCDNLTLTVTRGSYAEQYCVENGLNYAFPGGQDADAGTDLTPGGAPSADDEESKLRNEMLEFWRGHREEMETFAAQMRALEEDDTDGRSFLYAVKENALYVFDGVHVKAQEKITEHPILSEAAFFGETQAFEWVAWWSSWFDCSACTFTGEVYDSELDRLYAELYLFYSEETPVTDEYRIIEPLGENWYFYCEYKE